MAENKFAKSAPNRPAVLVASPSRDRKVIQITHTPTWTFPRRTDSKERYMGSISEILPGLISALSSGDLDITALLGSLLGGSSEQQQPS